jgi:hypothetical protein
MTNTCAVCGNETTQELCDRCNGLLKLFNHDPAQLRKAAAILEKYNMVQRPNGSVDLYPKKG